MDKENKGGGEGIYSVEFKGNVDRSEDEGK